MKPSRGETLAPHECSSYLHLFLCERNFLD